MYVDAFQKVILATFSNFFVYMFLGMPRSLVARFQHD